MPHNNSLQKSTLTSLGRLSTDVRFYMKGLNMKRLNGWARLGIVLSVAWVAISSYVYIDEIFNHPS